MSEGSTRGGWIAALSASNIIFYSAILFFVLCVFYFCRSKGIFFSITTINNTLIYPAPADLLESLRYTILYYILSHVMTQNVRLSYSRYFALAISALVRDPTLVNNPTQVTCMFAEAIVLVSSLTDSFLNSIKADLDQYLRAAKRLSQGKAIKSVKL